MQLIIDSRTPSARDFESLSVIGRRIYRKNSYLFSVEHSFITPRFYWLYFSYDNENLYSEVVYDTDADCERNNPRPKNQIELRNQLFACYDLEENLFYVSDYSKKKTVTDYIGDMLSCNVISKNIITSLDEFINTVNSIKSITLTQRRNIHTLSDGSTFQKMANIYGLDLPERARLKLDYGATPVGNLRSALQNFRMKRDADQYEDILVVGLDDLGLEQSFNFSTLVQRIDICSLKDENERFDPEIIKALFLQQLGGGPAENFV